jgi:hypothetical protein
MFLTAIEDFDYKPYIEHGAFNRGQLATENALLWECEGKIPDGVNSKIVVQAGFVTDLASLPWFTAIVLKKLGRHQRAAVLHDALTRHNIGTFLWAIKQFNAAMKQDGVVWWRRSLIVSGLTVGGYPAWKNPQPVVIV